MISKIPGLNLLKQTCDAKVDLVCFPWIGASPLCFISWIRYMPMEVNLWSIVLPKRGRYGFPDSVKTFENLISASSEAIKSNCKLPIVIFGHSIGALIGFEVSVRLSRQCEIMAVIPSAILPPFEFQIPDVNPSDNNEIIAFMQKFGTIPPEVKEDRQMIQFFLELASSDFEITKSYIKYIHRLIGVELHVFGASDDPLYSLCMLKKWQSYTTGLCKKYDFEGGHFYFESCKEKFFNKLNTILFSQQVKLVR